MKMNNYRLLRLALALTVCGVQAAEGEPDYGKCETTIEDFVVKVGALIASGGDLNAQSASGYMLLNQASAYGLADVVRELLGAGADVDAKDCYGRQPLHEAGSGEVVVALIDAGADVHALGSDGHTPLHRAAARRRDISVVSALIAAGASVHETDGKGRCRTPLHETMSGEAVKVLIDAGGDVNARDRYGRTPLHEAANRSCVGVITALIDGNAVVDAKDGSERTPLHVAAGHERGALAVKALIDAGADFNAIDKYGDTPLHRAVLFNHVKTATVLINASGIILDCICRAGLTPLEIAEGFDFDSEDDDVISKEGVVREKKPTIAFLIREKMAEQAAR